MGTLFVVATPIGNLLDITPRGLEVLKKVDLIACEDTRHSQKLLNHLGIKKKLISYHEHNEESRSDELIAALSDGKSVAVVSDAGTPAINDPGFRIVKKAIEMDAPLHLTWSCYRSEDLACGTCDSCALRLRGFKKAGVIDPIMYGTA